MVTLTLLSIASISASLPFNRLFSLSAVSLKDFNAREASFNVPAKSAPAMAVSILPNTEFTLLVSGSKTPLTACAIPWSCFAIR